MHTACIQPLDYSQSNPPQRPNPPALTPLPPTSLAGVVHQQDLQQQAAWRAADGAVHGAQEGAPGLVVEHYDDAGCGEVIRVHLRLAAEESTAGYSQGRAQ